MCHDFPGRRGSKWKARMYHLFAITVPQDRFYVQYIKRESISNSRPSTFTLQYLLHPLLQPLLYFIHSPGVPKVRSSNFMRYNFRSKLYSCMKFLGDVYCSIRYMYSEFQRPAFPPPPPPSFVVVVVFFFFFFFFFYHIL